MATVTRKDREAAIFLAGKLQVPLTRLEDLMAEFRAVAREEGAQGTRYSVRVDGIVESMHRTQPDAEHVAKAWRKGACIVEVEVVDEVARQDT